MVSYFYHGHDIKKRKKGSQKTHMREGAWTYRHVVQPVRTLGAQFFLRFVAAGADDDDDDSLSASVGEEGNNLAATVLPGCVQESTILSTRAVRY